VRANRKIIKITDIFRKEELAEMQKQVRDRLNPKYAQHYEALELIHGRKHLPR
jgi:hypothetical protein